MEGSWSTRRKHANSTQRVEFNSAKHCATVPPLLLLIWKTPVLKVTSSRWDKCNEFATTAQTWSIKQPEKCTQCHASNCNRLFFNKSLQMCQFILSETYKGFRVKEQHICNSLGWDIFTYAHFFSVQRSNHVYHPLLILSASTVQRVFSV